MQTPTIQFWIKFPTLGYVDCSDWLLECGDVDTIFNNYDTTLKLVETTASLSSTILADKSITTDFFTDKYIQFKFNGRVIFAGYIEKYTYISNKYTIDIDIVSVLNKLNTKMLQSVYEEDIKYELMYSLPNGSRYMYPKTVTWKDYVTFLGWDEYSTRKANGTLGDITGVPDSFTTVHSTNPYRLMQHIFYKLTGYVLYLGEYINYEPFPNPVPFYAKGVPLEWIWNMNQEYPCSNESGREFDDIPNWWDFFNVFMRAMFQIFWNPDYNRFQLSPLNGRALDGGWDNANTFETKEELFELIKNPTNSGCGYNNANLNCYNEEYIVQINPVDNQPFPKPEKNAEYLYPLIEGSPNYTANENLVFDIAKHIVFITGNYYCNLPYPNVQLKRFNGTYRRLIILTNPMYDNTDWDGYTFTNLLQNKFVNKDGIYFSELELYGRAS